MNVDLHRSRKPLAPPLLLLALLLGCSQPDGPVRYPVEGQVLYQGRPVAEARVVFHPQAEPDAQLPKPQAETDAEGRFKLTTLKPGDGAVPGPYMITVELRALRQIGEETVRDGRNLLPSRYGDPVKSGLSYEVQEGENQLPPLELKR